MVLGSADPAQPTEIRGRRNESDPAITESSDRSKQSKMEQSSLPVKRRSSPWTGSDVRTPRSATVRHLHNVDDDHLCLFKGS